MQRANEAAEEQMRPMLAQARSAGSRLDQLQRRIVELQAIPAALHQIESLMNGERHNLSLVAAGVAELRDVVDGERVNLGKIASAVNELREAEAGRAAATSTAVAKVEEFDDMMETIHVHLSTLSDRIDGIATALEGERRNLGLVAGGLDSLRRSVAGVEALNTRYAALSDGLVMVADRVDALAAPSTIPATERVDLAAG
jgi:methyl-accepting chemotaxis protein